MIKDDTKDQISLFELPQAVKPAEKPAQSQRPPEEQPAPAKRVERTRIQQKPPTRVAKEKRGARSAVTPKATIGPVPAGDVRLTANIRQELHLRLKIAAATQRTTIGELIEELVETYL